MQHLEVRYHQVRALTSEEAERKYFYQFGANISLAFTSIALFFALFVILTNLELIGQPLVLVYLVIFVISFFGIVIIGLSGFTKESIYAGLLGGVLGFFALVGMSMLFQTLSKLQLLETGPPGAIPITPFESWIYQLVFVAITEEIFFRHTLAYIVEIALARITPKYARRISLLGVTSIMFGVIHFAAYELNFWNIFNAIVAGAVLGFIRYGWPQKNEDGSVKMKTVEVDGTTIQVPEYRIGGLFASFLAHLIYNSVMLTQLLIVPWSF